MLNRAAPMMTPDYSLNAAPRQVGRSMNDPQRMQNVLRCLHEDVTVPPFLENLEIVSEFGTPNAAQVFTETGGRQFIPATNWTNWQDHIYRVDQPVDPINGLYRTRVYFAYAPPLPPSALLAS